MKFFYFSLALIFIGAANCLYSMSIKDYTAQDMCIATLLSEKHINDDIFSQNMSKIRHKRLTAIFKDVFPDIDRLTILKRIHKIICHDIQKANTINISRA